MLLFALLSARHDVFLPTCRSALLPRPSILLARRSFSARAAGNKVAWLLPLRLAARWPSKMSRSHLSVPRCLDAVSVCCSCSLSALLSLVGLIPTNSWTWFPPNLWTCGICLAQRMQGRPRFTVSWVQHLRTLFSWRYGSGCPLAPQPSACAAHRRRPLGPLFIWSRSQSCAVCW